MENHHGQRSVEPKVSIIIPTRDKYELLRACIDSIQAKTAYGNYEIVVINNDSSEAPTIEYLELLSSTGITVLEYPYVFNYSKISNFGADQTESDYLCFLNNDTEVIERSWLDHLMDHAVKDDVGVVGSRLMYSNGTIQHCGVALNHGGIVNHPYARMLQKDVFQGDEISKCHTVSAVTFACALVKKSVFFEVGGMDEQFRVGLNDIDFCMRATNSGYLSTMCNRSVLLHHESQTRGRVTKGARAIFFAVLESIRFIKKYPENVRKEIYFEKVG